VGARAIVTGPAVSRSRPWITRNAFMAAAAARGPGCWSFGACSGVGSEYSLKDLLDRLAPVVGASADRLC
jgi:hypothetical protein